MKSVVRVVDHKDDGRVDRKRVICAVRENVVRVFQEEVVRVVSKRIVRVNRKEVVCVVRDGGARTILHKFDPKNINQIKITSYLSPQKEVGKIGKEVGRLESDFEFELFFENICMNTEM